MGRGRQKAKHTKVARDLKYFSPDTNYGALQKELAGNPGDPKLAEDIAAWPEYGGSGGGTSSGGGIGFDESSFDDYDDDDSDEDDSDEDLAQHKTA
jgi:hypothetical protein